MKCGGKTKQYYYFTISYNNINISGRKERGVGILKHETTKFELIEILNNMKLIKDYNVEICDANILVDNQIIRIFSLYIPSSRLSQQITLEGFIELLNIMNYPKLILGDMNAQLQETRNKYTCKLGESLR